MKTKIVVIIFLLFSAVRGYAQDYPEFDALYDKMSGSSITMECTYIFRQSSKPNITGKAVIVSQDSSYIMKGNGLDIYCDGTTIWTVDVNAKEIIIEVPVPDNVDISNPARLFGMLKDCFCITESFVSSVGTTYVLVPVKPCGINACTVRISGGKLSGASFDIDGGELTVEILSMSFDAVLPADKFSFDVDNLPGDYIITDLR